MSKPTHFAYVVTEPKEGSDQKSFWHRVGSVFPHKSGKGFDVVIPDGISVTGRITCREPKERGEQANAECALAPPDRPAGLFLSAMEITMATIIHLHRPIWVFDGCCWEMQIGGRGVAALVPDTDERFPPSSWLSCIAHPFDDHGWCNVDFATLESGQATLEQWWSHLCRGRAYRPQ